MLIKKTPDIRSSEITPKSVYLNRRDFLAASGAALVAAGCGSVFDEVSAQQSGGRAKLTFKQSAFSTTEKQNTLDEITSYNNFYEFGTDKGDPKEHAGKLKPRPWSIAVEGDVAKPAKYDLDDFIKPYALEERVYRLRCVEAWSMVIPWIGIPLKDVISRVQPTGKAKYVEFETLADKSQMWYVARGDFPFPYIEGLRLDEAMHPLTILAVGLYGEVLPNQNGAPIRLVVPWKYGFKSIKSIVKMRFTDREPLNTWKRLQGSEYGFYANINPQVDHPRWSQAREVRLPGLLKNHRTEMFNGYADQVASLYSGMDLRKNY
jgi:sulfoxide reductase catalytic subunit YedY